MMSPYQIQEILHRSALRENDVTKQVLVPCLSNVSMKNSYNLRNIQFTGGADERGTDVEYYEVIGPDKNRFYTGIQVKKKDIGASAARELINQGSRAFEKEIIDPSDGRAYRLNRWIVATTGGITEPAKREIRTDLARYAKLISFWDGTKLGEFILENFYQEFISVMRIDPMLAGSSSGNVMWWDPDEPQALVNDFSSSVWSSIDISITAPLTSSGIYITVKPIDGNFPPVKCAVRSSTDEIVIESVLSQLSPHLLKVEPGETNIEAMLVGSSRPVDILSRGYLEFR